VIIFNQRQIFKRKVRKVFRKERKENPLNLRTYSNKKSLQEIPAGLMYN
jgi:hypothetical protein